MEILRIVDEILGGKHRPVYTDCFETLCWLEYSARLEDYELLVWAVRDIAATVTRVNEIMLIPVSRVPRPSQEPPVF